MQTVLPTGMSDRCQVEGIIVESVVEKNPKINYCLRIEASLERRRETAAESDRRNKSKLVFQFVGEPGAIETRRCYNCFQIKELSTDYFYRSGRRDPPLRRCDFSSACRSCKPELNRKQKERAYE